MKKEIFSKQLLSLIKINETLKKKNCILQAIQPKSEIIKIGLELDKKQSLNDQISFQITLFSVLLLFLIYFSIFNFFRKYQIKMKC